MGGTTDAYRILAGKLEGCTHVEDLSTNGRITK
jgi:hypothetical protein